MGRTRPYVGHEPGGKMVVFRSDTTPTEETHGDRFVLATGPFRTARGARFMAESGRNNPHCITVAQAERLAKKQAVFYLGLAIDAQ